MSNPVWYTGDRDPSISETITVAGEPFDLTGLTVRFLMRAIGSSTLKIDKAATIVTAAAGSVRYDWGVDDLDTPGFYLAWWEVTITGRIQAVQEAVLEVRDHGPTDGWLVELAEVRQAMEMRSENVALDEQIQRLIPVATREVQKFARREFVTTDDETRRFRLDRRLVDLAPYDLRSATTITLDPDGTAVELTTNDWIGQPSHIQYGVWQYLKLSDFIVIQTGTYITFGFNEIEIEGDWGFPTVPPDVKEAAIVAIRSWVRRDTSTYAQIDPELRSLVPDSLGTYKLPPASKALLDDYRRITV